MNLFANEKLKSSHQCSTNMCHDEYTDHSNDATDFDDDEVLKYMSDTTIPAGV